MELSVGDILQATRGTLLHGDPATVIYQVGTDTRNLNAGDMFVALQGQNFNGETFIQAAFQKGAAGVLTAGFGQQEVPPGRFVIQVPDATEGLGAIASYWRGLADPVVVAITGSAGKTTTKEMIAHLCSGSLACLATEGNKNNLVGLPLTLLRLTEKHSAAVLELGMNHPGELTALARIALPDIGVITNIGDAHIGNFGSIEALIRAKAEMFEAMPRTATAVINIDCPHCSIMAEAFRIPETVISYGQNERADVRIEKLELARPCGYQFRLRILEETAMVHLPVYGRYQIHNAAAAAAVAVTLGIEPEVVAQRLATFRAPSMRSEVEMVDGARLIKDCYNASPTAMMESLRSLGDMETEGRRIGVVGDMYELGEMTERYHRQVGIAASRARLDLVVAVGRHTGFITEEFTRRGGRAVAFETPEEAASFLDREVHVEDVVLVKGSRGVHLEIAIDQFKALRSAARQLVPAAKPAGVTTE